MIRSFSDRGSEDLYHGRRTARLRRFPADLRERALRKLDVLEGAQCLEDLAATPCNRLEALKGDLKGFHSIRVNDQWRIVFRWGEGDAWEVELTDCH